MFIHLVPKNISQDVAIISLHLVWMWTSCGILAYIPWGNINECKLLSNVMFTFEFVLNQTWSLDLTNLCVIHICRFIVWILNNWIASKVIVLDCKLFNLILILIVVQCFWSESLFSNMLSCFEMFAEIYGQAI